MDNSAGALAALSHELSTLTEHVAERVVAVEGREHMGSTGFFIAPHTIVTADHALDFDEVEVVYSDGRSESAESAGHDPATDLAFLRVATAGPVALGHADLANLRAGSLALAVARDHDGDVSVAFGAIGMAAGPWRAWRGGELEHFIRPAFDFSPRFSGSPLVDMAGRIIGMNTWALTRRQAVAVPHETIARIGEAIEKHGHAARGYLGIAMHEIELPDSLGGGPGVIVIGIAPDGPAERGGILVGDIITSLRGRRVNTSDEIAGLLDSTTVNAPVPVGIVRGGQEHELTITIGMRPHHHHD
jgi:S1-C subfamily serine protease